MTNEKNIAESLNPIERKILPILHNGITLSEISEKMNIDKTATLRTLNFLKNKNLITIQEEKTKIVKADINGLFYLKRGLPERRLLNQFEKEKQISFKEIKNIKNLNENEAKISLGTLKKKALIKISNGNITFIGKKEEISKKMLEEKFLEKLPYEFNLLKDEEKFALKNLITRKNIIEITDNKKISIKINEMGKRIMKMNLNENMIEQLTPKIIKQGSWKGKKFRRFDIQSQVPRLYGGKKHFVNQATDYSKKIWLEMGFKEMTGNIVTTGFWTFDALFTAQDHPVREMHDTFYLKNIKGKLPVTKNKIDIVKEVKKAHEGNVDGSKGWQQTWNEEDAKKVLLRTHTTCLSSRMLKKIAETKEFPAKYFALGKCFRNETIDWSHGFEFNQTEGIVVDENATFRQLLGYLTKFFNKMGCKKIKIVPAYFPYTEPSVEVHAWNEDRKVWVEIGGAGMFRPEVTIPMFGRHIPVLAWGPGFDRIIMEYFNIKDLREMYANDLNKLREMKFWRK